MRTLSLCLAIFAGGANAQTGRGEAIVKQLTERLLPLKDLSPDRGPKQTEIAEGFAAQMFQHYRIGIISKDLASSLTSALAGKDLTPENLTRLMQSMHGASTTPSCSSINRRVMMGWNGLTPAART